MYINSIHDYDIQIFNDILFADENDYSVINNFVLNAFKHFADKILKLL